MRSRLNGWLEARSSPYLIALSLALVTIVLSVDLLTGDELTLSIFYLAPTALADWFAGRRAGLVIGFLAGAAWYVAAAIEFHGYSNAFVSTSNAAVRIAFLLVIAQPSDHPEGDATSSHVLAETSSGCSFPKRTKRRPR